MNRLTQFWNQRYDIGRPLEADSAVSRVLNRYLVSNLVNAFPHVATKFFSYSSGEAIRRLIVNKEGGSFHCLRAIYEHDDPTKRGDWINRIFMQTPAVKAARNRRAIAQSLLRQCLESHPSELPALVLAFGGGDGNIEAEVIAKLNRPNVYYCSVDMDQRAAAEIEATYQRHGLQRRGMVHLGAVNGLLDLENIVETARQRFETNFDGVAVTVCHGIAEYLDIGSKGNDTLGAILGAAHHCARPGGFLAFSQTDHHDRVRFVERGLSLYMRLRSLDELALEVRKAGWRISVCEHEPMRLITMCLAQKTAAAQPRFDGPAVARPVHAAEPAVPRTRGQSTSAMADR
jgi:SAM-dependent methyltransferase